MSTADFSKIDFFELGDKTALICTDARTAETVRATLKDLGIKSHTADASGPAIERLRYTSYDCIIVQENFSASSIRSNAVMNYIASLPMAQRRNSFVCLLGPSFKTLDAMQAFAHSVHLVVNPSDLPNLTAILKKGLAEFDAMYRVYRNTIEAVGER